VRGVSRCPLFVELCAGLASVSLVLQGGAKARPPVSRMGNKRGYASAILWACGLRQGQGADRYLWCEPDPGCSALLHAYGQPEVLREAAEIIRGWKDEEPRALWERLKAEGPIRGASAGEVARHVLAGVWSYRQSEPSSGFLGPGQRRQDTTATATARLADLSLSSTLRDDARLVTPEPHAVVFIDPPYLNTTGYGHDLPRADVVAMARAWKGAGSLVCISEQEPIPELIADGWHALDITSTRKGQKRTFSKQQAEWLTMSEPPEWRPSEQIGLF
jgi:hypothetical protein